MKPPTYGLHGSPPHLGFSHETAMELDEEWLDFYLTTSSAAERKWWDSVKQK